MFLSQRATENIYNEILNSNLFSGQSHLATRYAALNGRINTFSNNSEFSQFSPTKQKIEFNNNNNTENLDSNHSKVTLSNTSSFQIALINTINNNKKVNRKLKLTIENNNEEEEIKKVKFFSPKKPHNQFAWDIVLEENIKTCEPSKKKNKFDFDCIPSDEEEAKE